MNFNTCMKFIIIAFSSSVLSQDCVFYGKICNHDVDCCGGCCIENICIDTYRSCADHEDLCLAHNCPPGQNCHLFQPDCHGCEAYAICKESKIEVENKSFQTIQA